jgi:hypothetical protein
VSDTRNDFSALYAWRVDMARRERVRARAPFGPARGKLLSALSAEEAHRLHEEMDTDDPHPLLLAVTHETWLRDARRVGFRPRSGASS